MAVDDTPLPVSPSRAAEAFDELSKPREALMKAIEKLILDMEEEGSMEAFSSMIAGMARPFLSILGTENHEARWQEIIKKYIEVGVTVIESNPYRGDVEFDIMSFNKTLDALGVSEESKAIVSVFVAKAKKEGDRVYKDHPRNRTDLTGRLSRQLSERPAPQEL